MRQLLKHGADISAQGGHYGNALQAAFAEGHSEIVRQLVEYGADVDAQGRALRQRVAGGFLWRMRR